MEYSEISMEEEEAKVTPVVEKCVKQNLILTLSHICQETVDSRLPTISFDSIHVIALHVVIRQ